MSDDKNKGSSGVHVAIAGGGPGGLLTSILLSQIGIPSTVLERTSKPDEWSSKSYTLVLGDRGKAALERGGCLDLATEKGMERKFVYIWDGKSEGGMKAIPKKSSGIGFTRPLVVECLEKVARDHEMVTLKRGAGVTGVTKLDESEKSDMPLQVHLDDGASISATHVIGADGKWSRVRQSFSSLSDQSAMITCPCFGVHLNCSTVPDGWKPDGTYVIKPSSEISDSMYYILASPRPNNEGLSISMVCYDEILEQHPWLAPPSDMRPEEYGHGGWEDEYSAKPETEKSDVSLSEHLKDFLQKEVPLFYNVLDEKTFGSARINRRTTWLKPMADEGNEISYCTEDGLVALIGDAAHAMTPSMGEGCNTALESAVKLVDCISSAMKKEGEDICSVDTVTKALLKYGAERPKEVRSVQEMSASKNSLPKRPSAQ